MSRARLLQVAGIAAVGVLVLELLLTHVAQRYLINSRSMEPTLHGDPQRGDIVLVDKAGLLRAHDPSALARFDIVVVTDPENPARPLVKRVGSLGDEMLRIQDGDLFVRPLSGSPWRRVQKDPLQRDLRFTFYEHRAEAPASEPLVRYLNLGAGADGRIAMLPAAARPQELLAAIADARAADPAHSRVLASVVPIDVSFIDADGRRSAATDRVSDDAGIEVDLELAATCRGLALALVLRGETFAVAYQRDGALTWSGLAASGPERGPALGARVSLTLGYLDGRLFLEADGALVAAIEQPLPPSDERDLGNSVRLAVAGEADAIAVRVSRVRLFHDVYYDAANQPWVGIKEYRIDPDQVFLLGDNSLDSIDSRARGPFPAGDIVGRPVAVIGPRRRAHWLPR